MHKGEQPEQSVVIGIEIAVFVRNMLRIPKPMNELAALVVRTSQRYSRRRSHQPQ